MFDSTHLKTVFDAIQTNDSTWVCGWSRNLLQKNDTVLLKVRGVQQTVLVKKKKGDAKVDTPTDIDAFGKNILFARQNGSQIWAYNTQSQNFKVVYNDNELNFGSMCCSRTHIFVFDKNNPEFIRVLDSSFYHRENIPSSFEDTQKSDVDMCLIPSSHADHQSETTEVDDIIVLRKAAPNGMVRVINRTKNIWQLDENTNPHFKEHFSPCSVSASSEGDIFVADRGKSEVGVYSTSTGLFSEI